VEPRSARADGSPNDLVAPPRQRWRLVLARSAGAPRLAGRDLSDAWESALEASGLPIHRPAGKARGRVAFGAPLQAGIAAQRELAEIFLSERVPLWRVREALKPQLPDGWALVELFDVWVGGPPLAGRVVGADYRIELDAPADPELATAARGLLEARELPRVRLKAESAVAYDLRPLLLDLSVDTSGDRASLRVRVRIHPELGVGRPEEVVAALADRLRREIDVHSVTRERVILSGDTA
jgi:radical SAM-linked protein